MIEFQAYHDPSMIVVIYHQVKTSISFWCRRGYDCDFFSFYFP